MDGTVTLIRLYNRPGFGGAIDVNELPLSLILSWYEQKRYVSC